MRQLPKPSFSHLNGCFVAGGEILSIVTKSPVNDYDIYPKSKKDALNILIQLIEEEDCFVVAYSDRAITLKQNTGIRDEERPTIQVMIFDEFPTANVIFEFFDFTVCMGAFDCDSKEYHFHDDFWSDVASKTLVFNQNTKHPLNSLLRVHKYNQKGYILPKSQAIKIGLTLSKTEMPSTWEELESAIGGAYGRVLKLHVGDLECNYENIMTVMDSIILDSLDVYEGVFEDSLNILEYFSTKKDSLKIELAYKILTKDIINVIKINDDYHYFDIDNKIIGDKIFYKDDKLDSNIVVHENIVFSGYKYVECRDGVYTPLHYKNGEIKEYISGETVETTKSPHIFVFRDRKCGYIKPVGSVSPKQICEMVVKYNSSDIKSITPLGEITVSKMEIVSILNSTQFKEIKINQYENICDDGDNNDEKM